MRSSSQRPRILVRTSNHEASRVRHHDEARAAESEQHAVLDRIGDLGEVQGGDVVLDGELAQPLKRRLHVERQYRSPEDNQKRQHQQDE